MDTLFFTQNNLSQTIFLWAIFGYIISHLDCNIQLKIKEFPFVGYICLFICAFFLFVIPHYNVSIDKIQKDPTISELLLRATLLFLILVLWIKSKWQFAAFAFVILIIEQFIRLHYLIKIKESTDNTQKDDYYHIIHAYSRISGCIILISIIIGFIIYIIEGIRKGEDAKSQVWRLFVCKN